MRPFLLLGKVICMKVPTEKPKTNRDLQGDQALLMLLQNGTVERGALLRRGHNRLRIHRLGAQLHTGSLG